MPNITLTTKEKSRLLHEAGVDQVLDLCKEHKPGHQWRLSGQKIQGQCLFPNHNDTNPSFAIMFHNGRVIAKCLSCGELTTNGFRILKLITGISDELRLLNEVLGMRMRVKFDDSVEDALVQEERFQTVKKAIIHASSQVLHNAMHSHDAEWDYAQDAVRFLQKRNVQAQALPLLDLGVFPKLRHFHQFAQHNYASALGDFPDYLGPQVFNAQPQVVGKYGGWLVFPYRLDRSRIGRIKLRDPNVKTNMTMLGSDRTETLGFFGMATSSYSEDAKTAIVVEGEFDQIALIQDQKYNGRSREPVIVAAGGGGKTTDIDMLADIGVERVVIAGDNDKGGNTFTRTLLMRSSQSEIRDIRVYDWSDKLRKANIKDPDEAVQKGMVQEFLGTVMSPTDTLSMSEWAVEATKQELAGLLGPPEVQQVVRAAKNYADLLVDPSATEDFCRQIAVTFGVDQKIVDKHIGIATTEAMLRFNMLSLLFRTTTPLYRTSQHAFQVYAKETRRTLEIDMGTVRKMLSSWRFVFGAPVFDFIEERLGIPAWVEMDMSAKRPKPRSRMVQKRMIEEAFDDAVAAYSAQLRPLSDLMVCKQGVHWADADENARDDALLPEGVPRQRVYIVNGDRVYRGEPDPVTGLARYVELEEPRDGAYVFELEPQPWSAAITGPEALEHGGKLSHKECFEMRHAMLDCWHFKDQEPTQTFLAAQIGVLLPCLAFDYLPFIFFTAQTQSGKSTLLKGLIGGSDPKEIGVLEGAVVSEDYTAAGVLQHATGVALPMCLDEFEDPASCTSRQKANAVQSLLEMTRNASQGSKQLRGTRDGQGREHMRRFLLMTAGIAPFQQGQDLNRWFTIELETVKGLETPETVIAKQYTTDQIKELKRSTTLNGMRDIFKMREMGQKYLYEGLSNGRIDIQQTRFFKAMESCLAALELAEYPDVWGFAQEFLALNEAYVTRASSTDEELMYHAVMDTPSFVVGADKSRYSLVQMLADPDRRPHINSNGMGVFHIPAEEIVVIWPQQALRLLRDTRRFRDASSGHQVMDMLARNPEVHHDPEFFEQNPAIIQYLRAYMSQVDPNRLLYVRWSDLSFTKPNLLNYTSGDFDDEN